MRRSTAVGIAVALLGCERGEAVRVGPFLPGERAILVAAAVASGVERFAMEVEPTLVELPGPATALEVATSSQTLAELGLAAGPLTLAASRASGRVLRYERLLAGAPLSSAPLTAERLLWPLAIPEDPPEACLERGGCWLDRPPEGYGRCVVPCPAPAAIRGPLPPQPPDAPCAPGFAATRTASGVPTCGTATAACGALGRFDRDTGSCVEPGFGWSCDDRSRDPPDAVYVRAGGPPGDGTLAAPYPYVETALSRGAERVILLPADEPDRGGVRVGPDQAVEIVGACPERSRLEGLTEIRGRARLVNLRLLGASPERPAIRVYGRLAVEASIVEGGSLGLEVLEGGTATVASSRLGADPRAYAAVVRGELAALDSELEGALAAVGGRVQLRRSRMFGTGPDRFTLRATATRAGPRVPADVSAIESAVVGVPGEAEAVGIVVDQGSRLALHRSVVVRARSDQIRDTLSIVDAETELRASHLDGGGVLVSRSRATIADSVLAGEGLGLAIEGSAVTLDRVAIDVDRQVVRVTGRGAELAATDLYAVDRAGTLPVLAAVGARLSLTRARLENVAIEGIGARLELLDLDLLDAKECVSCDASGRCVDCAGTIFSDDASELDLARARIAVVRRRAIDVRASSAGGGAGRLTLAEVSLVGEPGCDGCRGLTFFPSDTSELEVSLRGVRLEGLSHGLRIGQFDVDLWAERLDFDAVDCLFAVPASFDLGRVAVRAHASGSELVRCSPLE